MDDRVAKALLENNILERQKKAEADIALLQKLATNPSLVLQTLPNPTIPNNLNGACCVYRPVPIAMLQSLFTTGSGVGNIVHDLVAGIAYTQNILDVPVHWIEWNDGLTSTQYQAVNIIFMTPNGAVYAVHAYDIHANSFIARASSIGQPFEIILGPDEITDLTSSDYGLGGIYFNPNEPEEVMFVLDRAGSNTIKFFFGANGIWTAGYTINGAASTNASMRFGSLTDHWIVNIGGVIYIMPADVSSVLSSHAAGTYTMGYMERSPSGYIYFYPDDINKINFATGDGAAFTQDDSNKTSNQITPEATGLYLMAIDSTRGIRSTDGGYTWENIPDLPLGSYDFVWIGGEEANSQWVAVGGQYVYYSADFGDTWSDRIGDLTDIVALPDLDLVCSFGTLEKLCGDGDQTEALVISISDSDPLSVHITGGLYQGQDGWSFSSTTDPDLSIASHIPGSGMRIVGFQSNDTTGVFTIVDGSIFDISHVPTKNDLPATDAGNTMLFFLLLYAGEVGICDDDFIVAAPTPVDQTKLKTAYQIHAAEELTELSNDDEIGAWNSLTGLLGKIKYSNLFAQITAALTIIFDALYAAIGHTHAPSHVHGLERWNGASGQDTFDCVDVLDGIESLLINGLEEDPIVYTLSSDGTQIILDTALPSDSLVVAHTLLEVT